MAGPGPDQAEPAVRTGAAALAAGLLDAEARRQSEQYARGSDLPPDGGPLPGVGGPTLSLGETLRAGGPALVALLSALVLVDSLGNAAFAVLGPDIQRTLHLSELSLGVVGALGGLVVFVAAVPLGYLGDRGRRTGIVGVCSVSMAAFVLLTGAAHRVWQLVLVWALAGVAKANEQPVHGSLLADGYPIAGRNHVYGLHRGAQPVGGVIGPALAGAVAAAAGGTGGWRWAFVVIAIPAAVLGVIALGLPEPARGGNEMMSVLGAELDHRDEPAIPFGAAFARLKKVKTFYFLLCALGVFGLAVVAAPIYTNLVLQHHFHQGAAARGVIGSLAAVGGVGGALIAGTAGDRLFSRAPERSLVLTGILVCAFGVTVPLAVYMPNVELYTVVTAISEAAVFAAFVPTAAVVAAVTPYQLRSLGFASIGLYLSLIGGLGGALLVGGLASTLGDRLALALVCPPAAFIGGGLIAYGARYLRTDMALTVADLEEEREEQELRRQGRALPMLQIRHLDFSYGVVQVLFDVNLDVRRGEVLALLGTNGAGKSTLLRAVSGLGVPDRGVIRLDGRAVTYAEPVTRVRLGIVQMSGGHAIFPGLSVAENLLAGAYTFIWDRALLERRLGEVLALFPVLSRRLDQPAGTLSGGEQQMLGLASALLLDPEILLIDELSLGLAPIVVAELLGVVEALKANGLTIVIVEQSVNVALSVADRAVFMEKGQIRFEGPAQDLLDRDDLVRAVFLGPEGG